MQMQSPMQKRDCSPLSSAGEGRDGRAVAEAHRHATCHCRTKVRDRGSDWRPGGGGGWSLHQASGCGGGEGGADVAEGRLQCASRSASAAHQAAAAWGCHLQRVG